MIVKERKLIETMPGHEPTKEQCEEARRRVLEINTEGLDKIGLTDAYCYQKLKMLSEYLQPVFVKRAKKVKGKVEIVDVQIRLDTPKAISIQKDAVLAIIEMRGRMPSKAFEIKGTGKNGEIPMRLMVEFVKPEQVQKRK